MAQPTFKITDGKTLLGNTVRLVEFEIPGGSTTPQEFALAVSDISSKLVGPFAVLLNGRGPVWGYGMLIHEAHASQAVATFDPRHGYVIVQTHVTHYGVGYSIESESLTF